MDTIAIVLGSIGIAFFVLATGLLTYSICNIGSKCSRIEEERDAKLLEENDGKNSN